MNTPFNKAINIDGDNTAGSGVNITVQVTLPGVSTFEAFDIGPGSNKTVALSNMTIKGGNVSASGGAIVMNQTNSLLSLENVTVRDSKARFGGGLYAANFSSVTITNCTFTSNTATTQGAAIRFLGAGNVTITASTFDSNTTSALETTNYGAVFFDNVSAQGSLTINRSTFSNNTIAATGSGKGGGLLVINVATVTINDSTFSGNDAGDNGYGGGIYQSGGQLILTNSTIFNNTADWFGGGLYITGATAFITNSTIANNSATDAPNTVIGDSDGVYLGGSSTLTVKNTIMANNVGTYDFELAGGSNVVDNGYNIVESSRNYAWTGTGDLTGEQANLNLSGALALNSSVKGTSTLALSTGSVAIDAGNSTDNGSIAVPATDQRGLSSATTKDIGAYEFGASSDTQAPTGTVSIDGGGSVKTVSATLTLSCSDNVGCSQMQFSNDNLTFSSLENYATSKSWSLVAGADGARTVYARFTDAAGNLSSVVNDSTTLDTIAPSAPSISSPSNNVVTANTARPEISGTAEANATITIKDGDSVLGMVTATGGNWSLPAGGATLTTGTHSFTATATDAAGNASTASTAVTYNVNANANAGAGDDTTPDDTNATTDDTAGTATTTAAASGGGSFGLFLMIPMVLAWLGTTIPSRMQ